ncbi:MAG: HlyD family secretion protein [Methylovirgula sp.]|uniref:HlyD family secretion protein n=1 Tax=Methylovirgula sp. TaxID=1978224 RepID=UPI003076125B
MTPFARQTIRITTTFFILGFAAIAAIGFWHYYLVGSWTRDGEVEANVVNLSPQISGRIIRIPVRDNQTVRKGDILYEIDPADFQIAVDVAAANVQSTLADATLKKAEAAGRAKLTDLAISPEEQEIYGSSAKVAEASYKLAVARLNEARLNLQRTKVVSTVNGYVTNLLLRPGDFATLGVGNISIVDSDSFWIAGYFEETKLSHIRIGDRAVAALLGFRDPVSGHVESIARGINIPNESRGNLGLASVSPVFSWVRLAQRIPVRVHIDSVPKTVELAVGMTATVSVGPDASPSSWHGWISRAASALFQGH